MLHAIRTLWSIAIFGIVFACAYWALNSTSEGARVVFHSALTNHIAPKWDEWVNYSGEGASEDTYQFSLYARSDRAREEPPSSWKPALAEWWKGPKDPSKTPFRMSVRHGQVYFGEPGGIPIHTFGLPFDIPTSQVFMTAIAVAFVCILIARLLGRSIDNEMKQKQLQRPGSILARGGTKKLAPRSTLQAKTIEPDKSWRNRRPEKPGLS